MTIYLVRVCIRPGTVPMHQVFGTRHSRHRSVRVPLGMSWVWVFLPGIVSPLPRRRALRLVGREPVRVCPPRSSKRKPKSAGASKTPADGGSVLCRYRVALSMARRDGGRRTIPTEPEPATRTTRDADLSARPAQAKDTRRRTRLVLLVLRRRRHDEFRQVRADASPRPRGRRRLRFRLRLRRSSRAVTSGSCARFPSVPSAFFARRATLAYTGPPGAPLLPAPRCGWAWKRRGKTTTDVSALSVRSLRFWSHFFPAGLERTLGPDADRRPRRSPVSRRSRALIALR